MNANEIMADLSLLAHAAYSMFVVLGLVMILLGMVLGWRWSRNRYFRGLHLAATLFCVLRVWSGIACPFSVAEDAFRSRVTAPCPLGAGFHTALRDCAFRGAAPRSFAGNATLFGVITVATFAFGEGLRGKRRTAQPA